jgi:hypothetical protein
MRISGFSIAHHTRFLKRLTERATSRPPSRASGHEGGQREPFDRTLDDVVDALEARGVEIIDRDVRLKDCAKRNGLPD